MKQKVLVSAIKKIVGAELLLSAAFVPAAFAQSAPAAPTTAGQQCGSSSARRCGKRRFGHQARTCRSDRDADPQLRQDGLQPGPDDYREGHHR
ncbi:MAG: hypothetical protein WDN30_15305 [Pararobbsia sp.]